MLIHHLQFITAERVGAAEPFVYHDAQSILVTGRLGLASNLLGCHVDECTRSFLLFPGVGAMDKGGYPEITKQDLIVWSQQDILRLDIAMDAPVIMRILQGSCDWLEIGHDGV